MMEPEATVSKKPAPTNRIFAAAAIIIVVVAFIGFPLVYLIGYGAGQSAGYTKGHDTGKQDGYDSGYNLGYDEGIQDEHNSNLALSAAFDEPLSNKQIPSSADLAVWLILDYTNKITYDSPNFVCGDFAVMLSQHAKLKHWDVGVVAINGYNADTLEPYAHALNMLYTQEGLVYIEPQTDRVFYYEGHEEMSVGSTCELPDGQSIIVTYYSIIVWA